MSTVQVSEHWEYLQVFHKEENAFHMFAGPQGYKQCILVTTECKAFVLKQTPQRAFTFWGHKKQPTAEGAQDTWGSHHVHTNVLLKANPSEA